MEERTCPCGATYTPKDAYATKRHEASAKHLNGLPTAEDTVTDEPFGDLFDEIEPFTIAKGDDGEPEIRPVAIAKAVKPKSSKVKVAKAAAAASASKACRVCSIDKPLEEYRRKASRPDGRDTICAACSKDWFIAHKAKKAGAK